MGGAPDQEKGKGKHGDTSINTLGIPKVIVKVCVLFPKLKVGVFFPDELKGLYKDPGEARPITLET